MAASKPAGAAKSAGAAAGAKSAAGAAPAGPGKVAADFAAVKTHGAGPAAHGGDASTHGLGAKAFTDGNDVHFKNAGNLNATAHEAAHVVQQGAAAPRPR